MPSFLVEAEKKCYHNSRLQYPGEQFTLEVEKKADLPNYVKVISEPQSGKKSTKKEKSSEAEGEEPQTLHEMNEKKQSQTVKSSAASKSEG
jgi:hypothetical protein